MINHIYGKLYNYTKSIKPAPDPHYLLSKFYGNLSINEYRKLLRKDRVLLVVDKPLTRVLPELHEDNNEYFINSNFYQPPTEQSSNESNFRLKRTSNKHDKVKIISDNFGLKVS